MKKLEEILASQENANDEEVEVIEIKFINGDFLEKGQEVIVIETTKTSVSIEANFSGYVYFHCKVGDRVPVGGVLAEIFDEYNQVEIEKLSQSKKVRTSAKVKHISKKALKLIQDNDLDINDFSNLDVITTADVQAQLQFSSTDFEKLFNMIDIDKDSLLIYGAGLQCQVVIDVLNELSLNPVAIFDSYSQESEVKGIPIFPSEYLTKFYDIGLKKAHICIGNFKAKFDISKLLLEHRFDIVSVIHPSSVVASSAYIGAGVFVGPLCLVGPYCSIEDFVQINNSATIAHHSTIGKGAMIADGSHIGGSVKIGQGSLIGIGVTVNRDLIIGDNVTIISGANIYGNILHNRNVKIAKNANLYEIK